MQTLKTRSLAATASLLVGGCTRAFRDVDIPAADKDPSPSIVVRAIPFRPASDPGAPTDVELSHPTSAAGAQSTILVSNVDAGAHLEISASALNGEPPSTTGGVRSLRLVITQGDSILIDGRTEAAAVQGKAPNGLAFLYRNWKPKRPIQLTVGSVPLVITATATNFHGTSNTLTVTYVPVDHASRNKDVLQDLTLTRVAGQNLYVASLPDAGPARPTGTLRALGGTGGPDVMLLRDGATGGQCGDPAVSVTLKKAGTAAPEDMAKLYGAQHPRLPRKISACANPAMPLPGELRVRARYRFN